MTTKYKHLIWDWNGTLLNDVWLCVEVMNSLLRTRNIKPLTIERYKEIFDFPVEKYYQRVGFDFNKESFELVGTEFIVAYDKRQFECKLHDKASEVVDILAGNGISQYVLSARQQSQLEKGITHYGLQKHIKRSIGLSNHYAAGKTGNARRFMKTHRINPLETLFVGDTFHDYEVANAIGADCILIPNGHHSYEKLQQTGAKILSDISALTTIE